MHPPFSFPSCGKENGPCTVQKKRPLGALRCSGPPRARGSAYRCKRRFGLALGHAIPFCEIDTADPWRRGWRASGCKDAFDQLLFYCLALRRSQYFGHQCSTGSSFRAFRFATRCPGGRRGCCVGPCCSFHQQPASGSEKRSKSMRRPPRRSQQYWHGTAVPTSQKAIACPKARPNRRLHRYADSRTATLHVCAKLRPKAVFSFGPCTARFLFHKMEKKMGGASLLDKPPCGSRSPPGRRPAAPPHPAAGASAQPSQ